MPTFVDMTGFDDCDSEHTKELLRIILLGKLKDNEQLANLKRQRLPQLKKQSSLGHEFVFQRINRIIAVCSYEPDSNLPRSLFAAINQVAKERDMTDSSSTCYFEIYGNCNLTHRLSCLYNIYILTNTECFFFAFINPLQDK